MIGCLAISRSLRRRSARLVGTLMVEVASKLQTNPLSRSVIVR